jgi:D-alanyl-D-alanine carboxypeptidase
MWRALIIPILILAGLGVFSLVSEPAEPERFSFQQGSTPVLQAAEAYLLPLSAPAYAPIRDTTIAPPIIDANAAMLAHLETGRVLYERNATANVPIASLTKLLSAIVAEDLFERSEIVTIASTSIRVDGQKQTLYRDERIAVGELVTMMLVESSNDAAYALADYAHQQGIDFVAQMNAMALSIGMQRCTFTDPAGLDDAAFCSADDLLRLVRYALSHAPQLWPVMAVPTLTVQSADGRIMHEIKSTNELLGTMEGIVGGKTGYTDGALGCLILVVKLPEKGDTLISIVLGSQGRFSDTRTLVRWAQEAYRWQ